MTQMWPGPLRVSEVKGRNTCYEGGFFSEDFLLSSSPMSILLPNMACPLTSGNRPEDTGKDRGHWERPDTGLAGWQPSWPYKLLQVKEE